MEQEKFSININKIKDEVKNAVNAEQRYWTENDAKMRAIAQHVPTYEDFRQIVLASHLKPLDKGESLKDNITKGNKVWNSIADPQATNFSDPKIDKSAKLDMQSLINSKPKNNLEFLKIWRKLEENHDNDAKWQLIQSLDDDFIHKLCQLNGELLGRFLVLFQDKIKQMIIVENTSETEKLQKENHICINIILSMLKSFAKSNRFELNRMFLKEDELISCKNVFKFIEETKSMNETEFKQLEKSFLK